MRIVQEVREQDKMSVLRQGAPSHERHEDMAGGEELCHMFMGAVRDALHPQAVGFQGIGDQAVIGAPMKGVVTVFCCPVGHICGIDGMAAEAVDDHGDCRGAAAVAAHGVFAAVEVVAPTDVSLVIVEHGTELSIQHIQIDLVCRIGALCLETGDVSFLTGEFDIGRRGVRFVRRGGGCLWFSESGDGLRQRSKLMFDKIPDSACSMEDVFHGKGAVEQIETGKQYDAADQYAEEEQNGRYALPGRTSGLHKDQLHRTGIGAGPWGQIRRTCLLYRIQRKMGSGAGWKFG